MKRYFAEYGHSTGWDAIPPIVMSEHEDGDYVRYDDVLALIAAAPKAEQAQALTDNEQYRMQMAGISTAAIGYWKECDGIHPDYDTPALRDVAKLYAKYAELYEKQQPEDKAEQQAEPIGRIVVYDNGQRYDIATNAGQRAKVLAMDGAEVFARPPAQQQLSEEAILELAKKAGFYFHDAGYAPTLHTRPLEYSQKCFERFARALLNGGTE